MKQRISHILTALFVGLVFTVSSVQAVEQQAIPQQCQKLFQATDKLLADAQNQPGTHTQLNKIQNKLNQSKKQILEMEVATQIKSCDHGLAKISNLSKIEDTEANN
ncbi:recombinase XerD [Actinobacillus succinogenes]|uniref:Recombinase XerD n=1 Tax=Actinobacillus succinogenes (strain ATCC 55618 / DSM 22257 / CCUG 43843 / 130Z) TaxID=339671 RepID=A6VQA2_ACTSZ|nr:DUF5339 domain-containing protein [Actinobacillus succinogenes]ABR75149.1 conserved hypothetical protein [Actinobacillus succinogenes 130Z]PHI40453.1 recombinase XerD [Actinobacillus succinogenes]